MITSPKYKPVQIFISISSAGDSHQIDEILRFCDFFLVSYLVILYYWGSTGVTTISEFNWGNSPKNSPKRGVNRQFQAKPAEYESIKV